MINTAKNLSKFLLQEKCDKKNLKLAVLMPDDTVIPIKDVELDVVNYQIRFIVEGEVDESPDTIGNYETLT